VKSNILYINQEKKTMGKLKINVNILYFYKKEFEKKP